MRITQSRESFVTLSAAYDVSADEPMRLLAPSVMSQRYLSDSDLEVVCRWKSPRALPRIRSNARDEVRDVTRWALATHHERFRIEILLLLHGVGWPTASVILHWFHPDPYPVMDVRALWSLGLSTPSAYTFPFWWSYVSKCRELSEALSLPMRSVDRALWQYSKLHGGPGAAA